MVACYRCGAYSSDRVVLLDKVCGGRKGARKGVLGRIASGNHPSCRKTRVGCYWKIEQGFWKVSAGMEFSRESEGSGEGGPGQGIKRAGPNGDRAGCSRPKLGEQELTAWKERNGRMPVGPPEGEASLEVVVSEGAVAGRIGLDEAGDWDMGELALWFGDG